MKRFLAVLAIMAIACLVFSHTCLADQVDNYCGEGGGALSVGGGCGGGGCGGGALSRTNGSRMNAPRSPRFQGPSIVEEPELTTAISAAQIVIPVATVGAPHVGKHVTIKKDVTIQKNGAIVKDISIEKEVAIRRGRPPVIGVPTSSGYFYQRRHLGVLGLRGVQEQFHKYGS